VTKALFVTHTAAPSGAEIGVARLAAALREVGVDTAMAFGEDGPMVARMRADGFETTVLPGHEASRSMSLADRRPHRLALGFARFLRLGWALGSVVRTCGATVVVAHSTKALVMGCVAARRARVPLVWHVHDRISHEYFGPVLAPVIRSLGWTVSHGYVANSRSTLDTLLLTRRRSIVAYPACWPVTSSPAPHADRPAGDGTERDPCETVVAVVGRLTPWKGQDVFLRAVAATAVRPTRIYLVGGTFFGEEPFRAQLERLAAELGLPVTFTGHVDDPETYMQRADILVHCSVIAEPFGQVVVQGMRAGCAVIASGPGGTTEIVEPGVSGILVDAGDQQQLTAALDRLIGDRGLRERLAHGGRRRAADFDVIHTAREVAGFLEAVTGASAPSRRPTGASAPSRRRSRVAGTGRSAE
jgi:glycosyltransferase involved in cell wall biosynthesis